MTDSHEGLASGSEVSDLFAAIPVGLFSPLSSPNASLYWAVLARFFRYEFEETTTALVKTTAIELTEGVIRASKQWRDTPDRLISELKDESGEGVPSASGPEDAQAEDRKVQSLARSLVNRLEVSGWFHFEFQSRYGEVLNFFPYATRILDALTRVARDEQPILQAYAIGIVQALRPDILATRPGYAIREAKEKTVDFTRELKVLNRNIYMSTRRLIDEARTASGVLNELLNGYQRRVMGSFHRLKTVDNPFRHRGEILLRLDQIGSDQDIIDKAARWYKEELDLDLEGAKAAVVEALRVIRSQIETLPLLLNDIDARNSRFSGSARNRLIYLLSRNRHIGGQLQGLIDSLAAGMLETLPFDLYRARFLAEDFLYVPRQRVALVPPQPLGPHTEVNVEAMRERARQILARPFGRRAVSKFVLGTLGKRSTMPATELAVTTEDDYLRYICVVSYGSESQAPYRFIASTCPRPQCSDPTCPECHVAHGPYHVPNGLIERTQGRHV